MIYFSDFGAGGGGGSGHSYWRLVVTQTNGSGYFAITELEFLDSGGSNLVGGGTPIYSTQLDSSTPQHGAVNAFDGTKTSGAFATDGSSMPQHLGYHFASSVNVASIRITSRSSVDSTQAPRNGYVQYSDDGSSWTTAFDVYEQVNCGNHESRTIYDPAGLSGTGYLYWRVNVTANNGDLRLLINELEMRETSGGSDVTASSYAFASSNLGGYEPSKAFDDVIGTGNDNSWATSSGSTGWIEQRFPINRAITEIKMWARDTAFDQMPKDFSIQRTNHPVSGSWVTEWSESNETGWTSLESRIFTKP